MFKTIKRKLEYRKNKRIIKEELFSVLALGVPKISYMIYRLSDLTDIISNAMDELESGEGTNVIETIIDKSVSYFGIDKSHLADVLKYMARLTPDEIQTIIYDAHVKTAQK